MLFRSLLLLSYLAFSPLKDTVTPPLIEPVYMSVCWRGNENLERVRYNPKCTEEIVWKDLPIRVKISEDIPLFHRLAIQRTLYWWNFVLKRRVFVEVEYQYNVLVEPNWDCWTWRASATHFKEGAENTYRHEFGHILGLDHDPDHPDSLMYPYYGDDRILTPKDRGALIQRYGR